MNKKIHTLYLVTLCTAISMPLEAVDWRTWLANMYQRHYSSRSTAFKILAPASILGLGCALAYYKIQQKPNDWSSLLSTVQQNITQDNQAKNRAQDQPQQKVSFARSQQQYYAQRINRGLKGFVLEGYYPLVEDPVIITFVNQNKTLIGTLDHIVLGDVSEKNLQDAQQQVWSALSDQSFDPNKISIRLELNKTKDLPRPLVLALDKLYSNVATKDLHKETLQKTATTALNAIVDTAPWELTIISEAINDANKKISPNYSFNKSEKLKRLFYKVFKNQTTNDSIRTVIIHWFTTIENNKNPYMFTKALLYDIMDQLFQDTPMLKEFRNSEINRFITPILQVAVGDRERTAAAYKFLLNFLDHNQSNITSVKDHTDLHQMIFGLQQGAQAFIYNPKSAAQASAFQSKQENDKKKELEPLTAEEPAFYVARLKYLYELDTKKTSFSMVNTIRSINQSLSDPNNASLQQLNEHINNIQNYIKTSNSDKTAEIIDLTNRLLKTSDSLENFNNNHLENKNIFYRLVNMLFQDKPKTLNLLQQEELKENILPLLSSLQNSPCYTTQLKRNTQKILVSLNNFLRENIPSDHKESYNSLIKSIQRDMRIVHMTMPDIQNIINSLHKIYKVTQ